MVEINNIGYELIEEFRDGFNEEAFRTRYSEILSRYDFIVGDWGYNQLRLRGFFDDQNQKATYDTKISTLKEYLYEYCNFGCAYFVLKKVKK
ncbi:YutD family protein [Bacillus pinisoli]|uniref:YutD family protein n=1 Tax=Bacillus pinisoli TaxID=2901866 RepID=UPI001FF4E771|nr:YutD family protein [Bacillus pinisoli]